MIDSVAVQNIVPVLEIVPDSLRNVDGLSQGSVIAPFGGFWDGGADAVSSAAEIFGGQSSLYAPQSPDAVAPAVSVSDNAVYMLCVAALVAVYLFALFRYSSEAGVLFKRIFAKKQVTHKEEYSYSFGVFMKLMLVSTFLVLSIGAIKSFELYKGIAVVLPASVILLGVPLVALILLSVTFLQSLFLRFVGKLTLSSDFISELIFIKRALFAIFGLISVPVLMSAAFTHGIWAEVSLMIAALLANAVILIYLIKSFLFFIGQKFSVLLWILYLCAVELIPFTMVIVILVRLF